MFVTWTFRTIGFIISTISLGFPSVFVSHSSVALITDTV